MQNLKLFKRCKIDQPVLESAEKNSNEEIFNPKKLKLKLNYNNNTPQNRVFLFLIFYFFNKTYFKVQA